MYRSTIPGFPLLNLPYCQWDGAFSFNLCCNESNGMVLSASTSVLMHPMEWCIHLERITSGQYERSNVKPNLEKVGSNLLFIDLNTHHHQKLSFWRISNLDLDGKKKVPGPARVVNQIPLPELTGLPPAWPWWANALGTSQCISHR